MANRRTHARRPCGTEAVAICCALSALVVGCYASHERPVTTEVRSDAGEPLSCWSDEIDLPTPSSGCTEAITIVGTGTIRCVIGAGVEIEGATIRWHAHPTEPLIAYARFEGGVAEAHVAGGWECDCLDSRSRWGYASFGEFGREEVFGFLEPAAEQSIVAHVGPEGARYSFFLCAGRHEPPIDVEPPWWLEAPWRERLYGP